MCHTTLITKLPIIVDGKFYATGTRQGLIRINLIRIIKKTACDIKPSFTQLYNVHTDRGM